MPEYAAAGDDGRIMIWKDNDWWGPRFPPVTKHLNGIGRPFAIRDGIEIVVAVGDDGAIVRRDGDLTFARVEPASGRDLNAIDFARGTDLAWAVGDEGTILHSHDGGASWLVQSSGVSVHLRAVHVESRSSVWAVGDQGTILHTANGGALWTRRHYGGKHLRGICGGALDRQRQYLAVGDDGAVLFSKDGERWIVTTAFANHKHLRAIARSPNGTVIAVGDDGLISRRAPHPLGADASDESRRWRNLRDITSKHLFAVTAWDDAHWLVGGDDGQTLTSRDGASWLVRQGYGNRIRAVA